MCEQQLLFPDLFELQSLILQDGDLIADFPDTDQEQLSEYGTEFESEIRPLAEREDDIRLQSFDDYTTTKIVLHEDLETTIIRLHEEIWLMQSRITNLEEDLQNRFSKIDMKKVKKNRTLVNRCRYTNRKKSFCKGYICKINGSSLCYAHHIMATSSQNALRRAKLY